MSSISAKCSRTVYLRGRGEALASVSVEEIDGVALPVPVALPPANAGGSDDLSQGSDLNTPWNLGLAYDVGSAMSSVGLSGRATKIKIALNNTLGAISEPSTVAFIAKKDFRLTVETEIPEPTSVALAGLALCGLGMLGRRQGC